MSILFKKTYKFAYKSAFYITLFSTVIVASLCAIFFQLSIWFIIAFYVLTFIFTFLLLQFRVEKFIYQRIKKIYDEITYLDSDELTNRTITTDMATLTRQVKKFASDKKSEIETLIDREAFRREFLGNVSHELKTPLFTVQGYISTLLDGAMKDKYIRKKYLERAEKGVERLICIVEDLDTIAKLESADSRLEMKVFDILQLIQSVMDLLEMKASAKNITLSFDKKYNKAIFVKANQDKIQQVILNLIENSIKYGKKGGITEIEMEDAINNKILINIKDNGEGIEKHNIPRLFERFFRVDKSGSRSEGGSGLGLAIVKHILEAHNERIYVESTFGKGSEFSFTLQKEK